MNETISWLEKRKEAEKNKMQFKEAFQELQSILEVLREGDYTIPEICDNEKFVETQWKNKSELPVVKQGQNGIRVKSQRNGRFRVCFYNEFSKPDNPVRLKISEKLREKGFEVV
ncbi:MAG: hypothetical protein HQ538_05220 [Parcubacteria group bacterium]|nr:hypothetical protein [Parcubacteria group bacterium]